MEKIIIPRVEKIQSIKEYRLDIENIKMKTLKRVKNKRYWYHCSDRDHRKSIKLAPRTYGKNRGEDEPNTDRICVAPKISNCLVAIPSIQMRKIYIYRTKNQIYAYYPYGIKDSKITREKWLIKPINFIKVDYIDFFEEGDLHKITDSSCNNDKEQIKLKYKIRRLLRKVCKRNKIKMPYKDI